MSSKPAPASRRSRRIPKLYVFRPHAHNSEEKLTPRYSSVWWNDKGVPFIKSYEILHDHYLRRDGDDPPLIAPVHHTLWLDLVLMAKRGIAFPLTQYADDLNLDPKTVYNALDRLQDVMLLHRVRVTDLKGHPIDLIVHSPLPLARLREERPRLLARVKERATAKLRTKLGKKKFPAETRRWKDLMIEFDSKKAAQKLEDIVAEILYTHITDHDFTHRNFVEELRRACIATGISLNHRLITLAFNIKTDLENKGGY